MLHQGPGTSVHEMINKLNTLEMQKNNNKQVMFFCDWSINDNKRKVQKQQLLPEERIRFRRIIITTIWRQLPHQREAAVSHQRG